MPTPSDPLAESYQQKFAEGEAAERERVLLILKTFRHGRTLAEHHIKEGTTVEQVKALAVNFRRWGQEKKTA